MVQNYSNPPNTVEQSDAMLHLLGHHVMGSESFVRVMLLTVPSYHSSYWLRPIEFDCNSVAKPFLHLMSLRKNSFIKNLCIVLLVFCFYHTFSCDRCLRRMTILSNFLLSTLILSLHTIEHFSRPIPIREYIKPILIISTSFFTKFYKQINGIEEFVEISKKKEKYRVKIAFPEVLSDGINKSCEWFTIVYFGRRLYIFVM